MSVGRLVVVWFSLLLVVSSKQNNTVCRDENGNPVDWFYLYKLPKEYPEHKENKTNNDSGLRYIFISSTDAKKEWQLSNRTINEITSFPGQTLSPLLNSTTTLLIAYNDQPPIGEVNFNDGHTKGVIAADSNTGFWLVHSVPEFPVIEKYDYPLTGKHYGQSFLCMTLNAAEMNLVGQQQLYNEPNIYYSRVPENLQKLYPNLVDAVHKKWRIDPPFWNTQDIYSTNNIKFTSFAKGRNFKKELYEDWVAPVLNTNLLVETWRRSPGKFPSNCTRKNRVYNIANVSMVEINFSFPTIHDHSKWCVTDEKDVGWICVGDINRSEHQTQRGGGTVCQQNKMLAEAYRNLVALYEPCP